MTYLQGAKNWLDETGTSLSLYLDPERKMYKMFGLSRSVTRVWSMKTIHYYAQQKAQVTLHLKTFQREDNNEIWISI